MLKPVLIGVGLIGVSVLVHSLGTSLLLRMLQHARESLWQQMGVAARPAVMMVSAIMLLTMHLIEVFVWAVAYWWLTGLEVISDFEDALYFSAVTFSTLGYGDITLTGDWRLLCGMQAISGILLCGWSTALLFAMVQYLWIREQTDVNDE